MRIADGLDAHVDAAALGELLGHLAHVLLAEVHGLGTERGSDGQALGDAVDGEHARRADGACRLHGAQADRAEAEHGDDIAGLQAARHDGVEAGAHDIAREQRRVIGHALGHPAQDEVRVRHDGHLRLRARQRSEPGAVAERARVLAAVVPAATAEIARSAGGLKAAEHPVADGDARDLVAGGNDGADVLVPDREARLDLDPPVVDVQVRPAHAARLDADDRVVGGDQLGLGDILYTDVAGRLEGDGAHRRRRCYLAATGRVVAVAHTAGAGRRSRTPYFAPLITAANARILTTWPRSVSATGKWRSACRRWSRRARSAVP